MNENSHKKRIVMSRQEKYYEMPGGKRQFAEYLIKYLKSPYRDNAIKYIEKSILSKFQSEDIPMDFHGLILEVVKYYNLIGEYDKAEAQLEKIKESRNVGVRLGAKYESYLMHVKKGIEKGEFNVSYEDVFNEILGRDKENLLESQNKEKITDYDITKSYFADVEIEDEKTKILPNNAKSMAEYLAGIPIEKLAMEIFPPSMSKTTPKPRDPKISDGDVKPITQKSYIEELSAINRLTFLKENFDIEKILVGVNNFAGTIIFEMANSNVVIAENFFRATREGYVEDYGKATYILPKDAALDLSALSRGQIKAKAGYENKIEPVEHRSVKWYSRVKEAFGKVEREDKNSKEMKTISGYQKPNIELQPHELISLVPIVKNIRSNEQFIEDIDENLGGILSNEVKSGLSQNAKYSFEQVYNNKLRQRVFEQIEDVTDINEKEKTAQKVLIYIKMLKSLSVVNTSNIKGEQLNETIKEAIENSPEMIRILEEHKDGGISYKDIKQEIRNAILEKDNHEIQQEELENSTENTIEPLLEEIVEPVSDINKEEISEEPEINDENEKVEETEQESQNVSDVLIPGDMPQDVKKQMIGMVTKFTEMLKLLNEKQAISERLDIEIKEKEEQLRASEQRKMTAQEEFERAKKNLEDAEASERKAQEEFENTVEAAEKAKEEEQKLKQKIDAIRELFE